MPSIEERVQILEDIYDNSKTVDQLEEVTAYDVNFKHTVFDPTSGSLKRMTGDKFPLGSQVPYSTVALLPPAGGNFIAYVHSDPNPITETTGNGTYVYEGGGWVKKNSGVENTINSTNTSMPVSGYAVSNLFNQQTKVRSITIPTLTDETFLSSSSGNTASISNRDTSVSLDFIPTSAGKVLAISGAKLDTTICFYRRAETGTTSFVSSQTDVYVGEVTVPNEANFFRVEVKTESKDSLVITEFESSYVNRRFFKNADFASEVAKKDKDSEFQNIHNLFTSIQRGRLNSNGTITADTSGSIHSEFIPVLTGKPFVISGLDISEFASMGTFGDIFIYDESKTFVRRERFRVNIPYRLSGTEKYIKFAISYINTVSQAYIDGITVQYALQGYSEPSTLELFEYSENYQPNIYYNKPLGDNLFSSRTTSGYVQDYSFVGFTDNNTIGNLLASPVAYLDLNKRYYLYTTFNNNSNNVRMKCYNDDGSFKYSLALKHNASITNSTKTLYIYEVYPLTNFARFEVNSQDVALSEKLADDIPAYELIKADYSERQEVFTSKEYEFFNLLRNFEFVDDADTGSEKRFRVPILPNENYTLYMSNQVTNNFFAGEIVDSDLNVIGNLSTYRVISTSNATDWSVSPQNIGHFISPANSAYIDLEFNPWNYQVLKGACLMHGQYLGLDIQEVNPSTTIDQSVVQKIQRNTFFDKKYAITLGDSNTYQGKLYANLVAETGIVTGISAWAGDDGGVGGSRIMPVPSGNTIAETDYSIWNRAKMLSAILADGTGSTSNSIGNDLTSYFIDNSDTIFVMGGTNDINKGALIGTVNDAPLLDRNSIPQTASYSYLIRSQDVTQQPATGLTYASCYKGLIETLIAEYPTKRIVLLSFIYKKDWQDYATSKQEMIEFWQLQKDIAKLYNVQFVDMLYSLGINQYNWQTYIPDEVHLSSAGGKRASDQVKRFI